MRIAKIIASNWPLKDKIGAIFSNNIDWFNGTDACVSMKKCNELADELIELIEHEKRLNPMFKKFTSSQEIEDFRVGDFLLIKWSDFFVKHTQNSEKIMVYSIKEIKHHSNEIILDSKNNHYFNYMMYLGFDTPRINTSQAEEIYFINKNLE